MTVRELPILNRTAAVITVATAANFAALGYGGVAGAPIHAGAPFGALRTNQSR